MLPRVTCSDTLCSAVKPILFPCHNSNDNRSKETEVPLKREADAKDKSNKKTQDEMNNLTAAKDRAQLSPASVMSILDVKVLADLIRGGSCYFMYVPLLVLVSSFADRCWVPQPDQRYKEPF